MKLIIFIHQEAAGQVTPLTNTVNTLCRGFHIQMYHTMAALKHRLRQYAGYGEKEVCILLADTAARLIEFSGLRELLEDRLLLFILPDQSPSTLNLALTFSPRFFTGLNTRYEDLCAVLNKMNFRN